VTLHLSLADPGEVQVKMKRNPSGTPNNIYFYKITSRAGNMYLKEACVQHKHNVLTLSRIVEAGFRRGPNPVDCQKSLLRPTNPESSPGPTAGPAEQTLPTPLAPPHAQATLPQTPRPSAKCATGEKRMLRSFTGISLTRSLATLAQKGYSRPREPAPCAGEEWKRSPRT
jgi:hypothetical protein